MVVLLAKVPFLILPSRWSCLGCNYCPFPEPLQIALRHDWPHVRLHYSATCMEEREVFKPENLSASSLCELDLSSGVRFETGGEVKLNALVAASTHLRSLHIGPGFRFSAADGKLPAIRELDLRGYWPYTSKEIPDIFDFSKLISLEIAGMRLLWAFYFLICAPLRVISSWGILRHY